MPPAVPSTGRKLLFKEGKIVKLVNLLLAATAIFISSSVKAETIYTECSACTSNAAFEYIAEYMGTSLGDNNNIVYVTNLENRVFKKFSVFSFKHFEPGMRDTIEVRARSLTSDEIAMKNKIFDGYEELKRSVYPVPEYVAGSAYDLVGNTSVQNQVTANFLTHQTNYNAFFNAIGATAGLITVWFNVSPTIYMSFDDGSTAAFTVGAINTLNDYELTLELAQDSDGNNIAKDKNEMLGQGQVTFNGSSSSGNLESFLETAHQFGVSVTSGGSSVSVVRTECTPNASGGLTCVYYID